MDVSSRNELNIMEQIAKKRDLSKPYMSTEKTQSLVLTDFDHFPYTRWWRGNIDSSRPIVAEREAGWRPRQDACYQNMPNRPEPLPLVDWCFETPCSTVFPCHPTVLYGTIGKQATNIASNRSCGVCDSCTAKV
jgi:hypothetical protein